MTRRAQTIFSSTQSVSAASFSYAIIDDGKIADTGMVGTDKASADTALFQGCSFSKIFTALAITCLAERNKFSLDDEVNAVLVGSDWQVPATQKFKRSVTVRQCLNMTSGLGFGAAKIAIPGYKRADTVPTLMDMLNGAAPAKNPAVEIICEPGTAFAYTGASYLVLQKIIEHVTGLSYKEFVAEQFLKPLNMSCSTFVCPLPENMHANVIPGLIEGGWENIPSAASGGLWTTACDMANLMLELIKAYNSQSKIISKSMLNEMQSCSELAHDFGLGLAIDADASEVNLRKIGFNVAYHNQLILFPRSGKGVVIMSNAAGKAELVKDMIANIAVQCDWPTYSDHFDETQRREGISNVKSKL